jgi:5-methylcytosine-specific restriction enzyme subunit McrC
MRLCRLRREDVEHLLERHRQHLEIEFAPERHWYRITPRGVTGVIVAPSCQLWILPKLAWDNFARLFDPAEQWFAEAPGNIGQSPRAMPEFLLDRFVHLLRKRIAVGLQKGYSERFEEVEQVRGQIDIAAQMQMGPGLPERFACHFDDLSIDIPCNRLVRALGERLLYSPWFDNRTRDGLQSLLASFGEVESANLSTAEFAQAKTDPRAAGYGPLLELGQLLFRASSLGRIDRPASFLFDMEQLFERYVTWGIQSQLADSDATIEEQPRFRWHQYDAGQPELFLRPDLVIRQKTACSIVDVKWKDFTGQPDADDLHQILAYAGALDADRAILVYPGRWYNSQVYRMQNARTLVELITLRMRGSREQCERSLQRLAHRITCG